MSPHRWAGCQVGEDRATGGLVVESGTLGMRKEAQCEGPDRMSMTWPEATSWTIRGVGTVVSLEAGGALLVAGAAGVALAQPVPVSREMAERIGTAERAERAKLLEAARGGPVALPTPSPFLNEQYVRTLPTQAQLDAHPQLAPHVVPGAAPTLPGDEAALEARRIYPNADSHVLAAGVRALGDTGRCFPQFESFTGNSRQAFKHLKDVMQPPDGWETHHLVEQNQTGRFGTQAIQNTASAINMPEAVHREVSREYASRLFPGTEAHKFKVEHPEANISTVRDYVKTLPYAEQRQFSIESIRRTLNNPDVHVTDQERATVEKEIQRLENPTLDKNLCPPLSQVPNQAAPEVAEERGIGDRGDGLVAHESQNQNGDRSTQGRSLGEHQLAVDSHPELHIFHDGQSQTVGVGHRQTGKIFNYGVLIGIQDDASAQRGLTMYPRQELFDLTPPEKRSALALALRDGNTLEIGVGSKGVAVHDMAPAHQISPALEHTRAIEQPKGRGLEL